MWLSRLCFLSLPLQLRRRRRNVREREPLSYIFGSFYSFQLLPWALVLKLENTEAPFSHLHLLAPVYVRLFISQEEEEENFPPLRGCIFLLRTLGKRDMPACGKEKAARKEKKRVCEMFQKQSRKDSFHVSGERECDWG